MILKKKKINSNKEAFHKRLNIFTNLKKIKTYIIINNITIK